MPSGLIEIFGMNESTILEDFSYSWDLGKICVRLGGRRGLRPAPSLLMEQIQELEKFLPELLRPRAAYTIIDRGETNGHPIFDKAVKVALGLSTIGPALETEVERSFRGGDPLRGLILDAFGSEAIVQTFRQIERRIVDDALRLGLWPSKRFSPGYKGWPLEEQRFLFSRVDAAAVGVRLNDACMMIPRKSNSFRINFYAERSLSTRRPAS